MDDSYLHQRDELLESIERDEEQVRLAARELTEAARETFDLGDYIRKGPIAWLIGGFVFGIWLGRSGLLWSKGESQ